VQYRYTLEQWSRMIEAAGFCITAMREPRPTAEALARQPGLHDAARLPYFLIFEALGPAIEFVGYLGFVFFFWFNLIDYDFALLFLLLAIIWGIWLNLGSILLDNIIFRRYRTLGDLLKLSFFGVIEFVGYRQLMVVERLFATLTCWRHGWGKPKRQELHDKTTKRTIQ